MPLTWSNMQSQAQDLTNDSSSTTLTFLKRNMNQGLHILESELGSFYTETTRTGTTTSGTSSYELPENFIRLKAFYMTVGTTQYLAQEIFDEDTWRRIQSTTQSSTSDYTSHIFVRRTTFEIFPTPSTSSLTYTLIYEAEGKDLLNDDYTTGTITTLTNGASAVTGSSTVFTAAMIGRYFRIDADGSWYEIATRSSDTAITLVKKYQGTSISAGSSAYTIGEMPRTPGPTHHIPCYYAAWQYYEGIKKDKKFGDMYKAQYEQYMQWAKRVYGRRYSQHVIPSQRNVANGVGLLNPNLFPEGMS